MTLSDRIDLLMPKVLKPSRYIGNEFNSITKDPGSVSVRRHKSAALAGLYRKRSGVPDKGELREKRADELFGRSENHKESHRGQAVRRLRAARHAGDGH